jgi:glycine/D-amino acid oxidase-like deaminating enzyme
MRNARTALIVGAGIGGLAAGLALRRAGWTVRIHERAVSPRELGFESVFIRTSLQLGRAVSAPFGASPTASPVILETCLPWATWTMESKRRPSEPVAMRCTGTFRSFRMTLRRNHPRRRPFWMSVLLASSLRFEPACRRRTPTTCGSTSYSSVMHFEHGALDA